MNTQTTRVGYAIALVCIAHFFSHFNMMLLPPLLPVLSQHLDIGFTELGFALAAYSFMSALTQTPMGFLVDRLGAPLILVAGVALEGLAFALIGYAPVYAVLLALLGIAGIANAVYHPADYSILNQVVEGSKIGKAFSYHTAAGLAGEAVAPATILLLSALLGWQNALLVCGITGVVVAVVLAANLSVFSIRNNSRNEPSDRSQKSSLRLLLSWPIIAGLLFFVGISLTSRGVNGFSVSALHVGHGLSLGTAGTLLSAWLIAAPLGVLSGGQLADRHTRHASVIALCFLIIAACLITLATTSLPMAVNLTLFAIGGFFSGAVAPSRDMLIRSVTPEGQTGKIFGFVSTGFNIGGMIAPPLYGFLLDQGYANGVFWMAALASLLTIATVIGTRRAGAAQQKLATL